MLKMAEVPIEAEVSRNQLVEWVRLYAEDNTDAVLNPECKAFIVPSIPGFIGYRQVSGCAIVFGDPVAASENKKIIAHEFHAYCHANDLEVIYVAASGSFGKWALDTSLCFISIEFGEKLFMDPQVNPFNNTGEKGSLVRRKVRHSQGKGVSVLEYAPLDPLLEKEMLEVSTTWLSSRKGKQIHISKVYLFEDRLGKRWFYAKQDSKIIGVLVLNRIETRNGWLLNHVMVLPDAPNGTSEALIIGAIDTVQKEGCHFVTVGPVPREELNNVTGLSGFASKVAHWAFSHIARYFHLERLGEFWKKFQPKGEPALLLFSEKRFGLKTIISLLKGLNVKL